MTRASLFERLSKSKPVLPEETVHVDEWQCDVVLRGWTSRERDEFEADSLQRAQAKAGNGAARRGVVDADLANFRARVVSRTIVENDQRTFANAAGEDVLGNQPANVLDRLFAVAQRLHGMSNQDVESLAKNSGAIPGDEHSSDSPGSQAEPSPN